MNYLSDIEDLVGKTISKVVNKDNDDELYALFTCTDDVLVIRSDIEIDSCGGLNSTSIEVYNESDLNMTEKFKLELISEVEYNTYIEEAKIEKLKLDEKIKLAKEDMQTLNDIIKKYGITSETFKKMFGGKM